MRNKTLATPHSDPRCPVTEQAMDMEYEYAVASSFADVRTALAALLADCRKAGAEAEDLGTIEVVMAEVLNNVVEHAYREQPGNQLGLRCVIHDTEILFRISDTGTAMPGLTLPEGKLPAADQPTEHLPEGGFGWHLIHMLTEDLVYVRDADRNRTSFVIPLSASLSRPPVTRP
jgi:serine/threonine-protein kinase RsbW